jgi:hypothetical protein
MPFPHVRDRLMQMTKSISILAALAAASALTALCASATDDTVATADKAFVQAYEKGDMAAVKKLLDVDFTWIDTDGVYYAKDDALALGLKLLVPSGGDVKIVEHKYGKVVWIQENQGNKYAAHFWVERPTGWKLLHNSEIATRPASENPDGRSPYAIPCVNPCQVMPYVAVTDNEKAAIKGWQEQEDGVPEHWRMHIGDDQVVIGSYGVSTKVDRWNGISKRNPNAPKVGVSPVLFARMWDLGTAVVAIMIQPTYGGKAYWSSRVFAPNKDGLWMMMESYHTTIQASGVMNEVQGK